MFSLSEVTVSRIETLSLCGGRLNKETISSRAYIAFKTEEQLALFSRSFDGHIFRDKAGACHPSPNDIPMLTLHVGAETQAVVEFAPYQKVPAEKSKMDGRIATIEEGMFDNTSLLCCAIYTNATQMKISFLSSNHWRTKIRSHLTKKHWNI